MTLWMSNHPWLSLLLWAFVAISLFGGFAFFVLVDGLMGRIEACERDIAHLLKQTPIVRYANFPAQKLGKFRSKFR